MCYLPLLRALAVCMYVTSPSNMNEPQDGFKWFGEGFNGFPKTLPEDCVEYAIYIIDSKLNELNKRDQLRKVQSAGHKLITELTKGFIWQREGIQFALERDKSQSFLHGRTNYGDSVEDEWFVVYILRELSKIFPEIWIRVVDTDGQFLLIEAAGVIPRWLNPEIADFRAWLNHGHLLIIPLDEHRASGIQPVPQVNIPSLNESLYFLEYHRSRLIKSPTIQAEAFYRLQKYPKQIQDSLHHAVIRIPRNLAYVLHDDPAHVSPAVEAFYLRDPIALRPLQARHPGELAFPPRDLVTVSTTFTKVSYAQLKSQQFSPPEAWVEASRFKGNFKSQVEDEMGMKLSCGFEMLLCDPQNQDKRAVREIKLILDDLQADAGLLPTDADMHKWGLREDDEKWLDIDYEEFEKELGGKGGKSAAGGDGGFGDQRAQDNLKKMVARFEDFLNDDAASIGGAEYLDDMDGDDEDDEDSVLNDDSGEAGEDKDISFSEDDFTSMMREMIGVPSSANYKYPLKVDLSNHDLVGSVSSDEEEDQALGQDMQTIENELREAGALDLDSKQGCDVSKPVLKAIDTRWSGTNQTRISSVAETVAEDADVDIDHNLAKHLLESFQSQGGNSGPGSNLMGMLGVQLPRNEKGLD